MMSNCRRYVDFPITDVLQMMGRAGRPQYDQHGVAVIMVADTKKSFYKKCAKSRLLPAAILVRFAINQPLNLSRGGDGGETQHYYCSYCYCYY